MKVQRRVWQRMTFKPATLARVIPSQASGQTKTLRAPELALPIIFLLAFPLVTVAFSGSEALSEFGIGGAVLYALLLFPALRLLRCRITLKKEEIVQHTFLGSRRVAARDVAAVKLRQLFMTGPPPYPTLHLTDGSIVGLAYAGGWVIGGWKNAAAIRSFYDHLTDTGPQGEGDRPHQREAR